MLENLRRPKRTAQSAVQVEVARRLMERLDGLKFEPQCVLDLGCGDGVQARALAERFPNARVIAMDRSIIRLEQARTARGRWRKRFALVAGDARHLPMAQGSVDLLFSSLMLPYCQDLPAILNGFRRVLKPGGLMLFSTLGPDSLSELRGGLHEADQQHHDYVFTDVQTVGNALMRAGFAEPVLDTDWFSSSYRRSVDLLRELRVMAPELWLGGDRGILRGFRAYRQPDDHYQTSWEVVYASAWAPEDGAPIRDFDGGEVASISVESIGRRRR